MNLTIEELKQKITEDTETWMRLACEKFCVDYVPVQVEFNIRGAGLAGQAWLSKRKIRYNIFIAYDNQDEFIARTIPHEVLHIVDGLIHGYTHGHGKVWKEMMQRCGLDSTRCHSYKTYMVKERREQHKKGIIK